MIPDRVWCFFGRHEPLLTLQRTTDGTIAKPRVVIWICQHCFRELGRTAVSLPPVEMTPLKVERLRNMIRRTNELARRARRTGDS